MYKRQLALISSPLKFFKKPISLGISSIKDLIIQIAKGRLITIYNIGRAMNVSTKPNLEKMINKGIAPTIGGIILMLKNHINKLIPPVLYLDMLYAAGKVSSKVNIALSIAAMLELKIFFKKPESSLIIYQ